MSEPLQEYVDSRSQRLRVDRAAGIVRGVKLLGLVSRNGRRYCERALVEAAGLYEGAKVNVNHPKGHPLAPRDYQDRLGVIRGVAFRTGEGLFGDLHINPKHSLSEQLLWDAEHAPQNVGLSHNVLARTVRDGESTVVETITKVQSIDVVADPASTAGLFEHVGRQESARGFPIERRAPDNGDTSLALDSKRLTLDALTLEQLQLHRPDLVRELRREQEVRLDELRSQVEQFSARAATARRRERIVELLEEHDLPLPSAEVDSCLVTPQFIESLMRAGDDATVRALVEERAALVRSARDWNIGRRRRERRPRSRDQLAVSLENTADRPRNGAELAAALRG